MKVENKADIFSISTLQELITTVLQSSFRITVSLVTKPLFGNWASCWTRCFPERCLMSSLVWPYTCLLRFLNTCQKVRTFLGTAQFTVLCFPSGDSHNKTKLERGWLTYFNSPTRVSTGSLERHEALSYERSGYDPRKTEIEPERRPVWTWLWLCLTPVRPNFNTVPSDSICFFL